MHHLEHCQFCIIIRFCFGTELHCTCIWILNDLVIQLCSYKLYKYNQLPRVSNVVICANSYAPRRASGFISPQPDLAGILVVLLIIIFLSKVTKLCKSCLSKCNWFVVWLRMTSEFFHPLSHLLRNEKAVGQISSFSKKCDHNGYCLSRSTMLSYTPIVVQN